VIPSATTLLVPVAGLDAVGRCVDEATVHRPHLLARICGIPLGSVITAAVVAAALAHRQGGLKRCPPGARAVPLVNKADDDAGLQLAEKIGNLLLESPLISHVVAGSALGSGSSFLRLDRRSPS
jgi:probable selenium-dependent hydroxylase accessory protein YqeC